MGHKHSHGHSHGNSSDKSSKNIIIVFFLNLVFAIIELIEIGRASCRERV